MKKMKILANLFNITIVLISIIYSTQTIKDGDIYNTLIRLSIIPVLYLPYILRLMKIKISDSSIFIYSIFIFLAHFLGSIVKLYGKIYWYDTFTHSLFGFICCFFVLEFLVKTNNFNQKKVIFNSFIIISIVALFAGLWETFEFTCDNLMNRDAQRVALTGVTDTMKDMIVAYLGSLLFITMYAYEYMCNKKYIIKKFINSI